MTVGMFGSIEECSRDLQIRSEVPGVRCLVSWLVLHILRERVERQFKDEFHNYPLTRLYDGLTGSDVIKKENKKSSGSSCESIQFGISFSM